MPTLPPDGTPNPERIVERIWAGRMKLLDLGIPPGQNNIVIVVSDEAYTILQARSDELLNKWRGAAMVHFGAPDIERATWTVFGIPLEPDRSLLRNEIRFRSEVVV